MFVNDYITTQTKKKNASKQSQDLISLIVSFGTLPATTDDILKLIVWKKESFTLKNEALDLISKIMAGSEESIITKEISYCFERFFREGNNKLMFITEDYSGIPSRETATQITKINSILKVFVDFVCSDNNSVESKKQALNSLKWMFRGREHECVIVIDMQKIWNTNKKYISDKEFLQSLLELVEVLMNFCVRKIREINQANDVTLIYPFNF